jgi:hypothetical protein
MSDVVLVNNTYKLRAGAPMPIGLGKFIIQTFMAEETTIDNYLYTTHLPASSDFRGRDGDYISANFTRLLDKNNESFQGKMVYNPVYVDEERVR